MGNGCVAHPFLLYPFLCRIIVTVLWLSFGVKSDVLNMLYPLVAHHQMVPVVGSRLTWIVHLPAGNIVGHPGPVIFWCIPALFIHFPDVYCGV